MDLLNFQQRNSPMTEFTIRMSKFDLAGLRFGLPPEGLKYIHVLLYVGGTCQQFSFGRVGASHNYFTATVLKLSARFYASLTQQDSNR